MYLGNQQKICGREDAGETANDISSSFLCRDRNQCCISLGNHAVDTYWPAVLKVTGTSSELVIFG